MADPIEVVVDLSRRSASVDFQTVKVVCTG
jgi:hypothetical protein